MRRALPPRQTKQPGTNRQGERKDQQICQQGILPEQLPQPAAKMPPQPGKVIIRPRQRGAGRTAQQQGSSYTDGGFQRAAFASRMIGPPAVQCLPQQLGTQQKVAEWDGKHARHAIQQHKAAGAASRQ